MTHMPREQEGDILVYIKRSYSQKEFLSKMQVPLTDFNKNGQFAANDKSDLEVL